MQKKVGISLIALIISVIVILVLSGAILITLTQNSTIEQTSEAAFRKNISEYNSELLLYTSAQYVESSGSFDVKNINASTPDELRNIITTMTDQDVLKFCIIEGKLVYIGRSLFEENIARDMGLEILTSSNSGIETYEDLHTIYNYSGNWEKTTTVAVDGLYSYANKSIGHGQSSVTTFNINNIHDNGYTYNLYFDYIISSEYAHDFFNVYINGVKVYQVSGDKQSYCELPLSLGNNTIKFEYIKDGSISYGYDSIFVDNLQVRSETLIAPIISFTNNINTNKLDVIIEYPNLTAINEYSLDGETWVEYTSPLSVETNTTVYARYFIITGEQSPISSVLVVNTYDSIIETYEEENTIYEYSGDWFRTTTLAVDGNYSYRSGVIGHNGTSSTTFNVEVPDDGFNYNLYFDYIVSSEKSCDFFKVYINGTLVLQDSGERTSYLERPLKTGTNIITFQYTKDGSVNRAHDAVFVDNIQYRRGELSAPIITTAAYLSDHTIDVNIKAPIYSASVKYSTDGIVWKDYFNVVNVQTDTTVYAKYYTGIGEESPISSLFVQYIYRSDIETYEEESTIYEYTGDWFRTKILAVDGKYSYRSGVIGHNGVSSTTFNVEIPDNGFNYNIYFDYILSSEASCDFFKVYINGSLVHQDSGERTSYLEKPLKTGTNIIMFQYTKDGSVNRGHDAVFVDNLQYKRGELSAPKATYANHSSSVFDLTDYTVDVTILYPEKATIKEYSFDGVVWRKYYEPVNVKNETVVYAKYYTGIGEESPISSVLAKYSYSSEAETYESENTIYEYTGDWFRTTTVAVSGKYSYRSGVIGHNGTSSTTFNVEVPDNGFNYNLYFDYILSSETSCDFFKVYINGTLVLQDSGEKTSYLEKPLKTGTNIILLQYTKDGSVNRGHDAVFIDNLKYTRGALSAPIITFTNRSTSINELVDYTVDVTIKYPELCTIKKYSFDGLIWHDYTSKINVETDTTVYAKYFTGIEEESPISSVVAIYIYGSEIETYETEDTIYEYTGNWFRTSTVAVSGKYSYRNNTITHNQNTSTTFNLEVPNNGFNYNLYFDYIISSESGCDFLKVYINGSLVYQDSGEKTSYCERPLQAGNNVISLQYTKDGSVNRGHDAVFIDNLHFRRGALAAPTISAINGSSINMVEVAITYPLLATIRQYSLDGVTWYDYTSKLNVQSNTTVYARYYTGIGEESPIRSQTVVYQ